MRACLTPLFFLILPTDAYTDGHTSYFSIDSTNYSEPVSLNALSNRWNNKLHDGNSIFSINRIEAGIRSRDWHIGLFRRAEYFYQFTSDTALLKHQTENKDTLSPNDQYSIQLNTNSFDANGISAGRQIQFNDITIDITASYLQGNQLTSGVIVGQATVIDSRRYDFLFDVDYVYSQDKLFDRQVNEPAGNGYSLDLAIRWKQERWTIELKAQDILARIYWKRSPHTQATGNTDTETVDEDGYILFKPVISGVENNINFTQKPNRKIHFASTYHLNNLQLLYQYDDYSIERFHSIGTQWTLYTGTISLLYNVNAKALRTSYKNQWFNLELATDKLSRQDARFFSFIISTSIPL